MVYIINKLIEIIKNYNPSKMKLNSTNRCLLIIMSSRYRVNAIARKRKKKKKIGQTQQIVGNELYNMIEDHSM